MMGVGGGVVGHDCGSGVIAIYGVIGLWYNCFEGSGGDWSHQKFWLPIKKIFFLILYILYI